MAKVISLKERFWAKVDKSGDCWLWLAGKDPGGYGRIRFERKNWKAHRVAWILTKGIIPRGLCVLHRCDTPACVRSSHLWLGTKEENWADMRRKGRGVNPPVHSGETHHKAKVTEDDVRRMRSLYPEFNYTELGQMFGVSNVQATNIVTRKHWANI